MPLSHFHPITAGWFRERFREPTEPQRLGWPQIVADRHTLIAAPTGSGKTLAAFLVCIDRLLRQGLEGTLPPSTQVVYVSPLKALSNDVQRNLEIPLAEIRQRALDAGLEVPPLSVMVRSGDTPPGRRQAMIRRPPHILVTTPESLYLLVTSARGREMLRDVRTVIVDEIHALARDKRGSHLSLSLQRLAALCPAPPTRIGLSATQRPIDEIARFLVGSSAVEPDGRPQCRIVDVGHMRDLDLAVEVPPSALSAVCSNETWQEIYERLCRMILSHRSTLVFVNTRRLAERVTHRLSELLGQDAVASHHGSLSKEIRLSAERRLASGELKAIVATASLELGIDVGFIDLVCQIGSPRSVATLLQRVGRSGHSLGALPKGRLFPLTRDELLECLALVRAVRHGRLDQIEIPQEPLDILAQQIVAAVAAEPYREDDLFQLCRGAWPYRALERSAFDSVVEMLSEGLRPGNRRGAWLHRDRIHGLLKPRRGARLAALTSGGAIPEMADYRVVTEDDRTLVGTVNEDFAIESLAGDVFLLGNSSWRIRYVRGGEVVVQDAQAAPANVPFWLGEAPGRTVELSAELSRLREELADRIVLRNATGGNGLAGGNGATGGPAADEATQREIRSWLERECGAGEWPARQAVDYVAAQQAAMGMVPTQRRIVFERFFDESGGMQLVIHSPLGVRINRAWGLALRKRFCRSFNFELQASADDNGIVLSLGPQHSFPIERMFGMLNRGNARELLVQALLAVPMFGVRWRWNATRALLVLRQRGGRKVPPPLQRFRADDLLTQVFPAQTACLENVVGDIEVPDHPLVNQTVHDCLTEAMDVDRWLALIDAIEARSVELVGKDTREPSPFSHQILNANPYAFLDDAPLEERRARAVATRRTLSVEDLGDIGQLDPAAIELVRSEAWPLVRDADELHDTLLSLAVLPAEDGPPWSSYFDELLAAGRAAELAPPDGPRLWVAAERLSLARAAYPGSVASPELSLPEALSQPADPIEAYEAIVRGRLEAVGPVTAEKIAADLGLRPAAVTAALEALEGEGAVLRGRYTAAADGVEWCERRLLARIHRLSLAQARRQVQPVDVTDFWRFLLVHQHAAPDGQWQGRGGLREVIAQLQGFEAPAGAWERDLLSGRVQDYESGWLDELSLAGEVVWGRLQPPKRADDGPPSMSGLSRLVPISIVSRGDLAWLLPAGRAGSANTARSNARLVYETLQGQGALFVQDLAALTGLLPAQLEEALGELAYLGLVSADGFAPIRRIAGGDRHRAWAPTRRLKRPARGTRSGGGGRWWQFPGRVADVSAGERLEQWARQLLRRYGVMFRDLLTRESAAPAWRELVAVYRRWEAQGRIRGGRFVAGVGGEQYAEPSVIDELRRVRQSDASRQWVVVSAADPSNLAGILTAGARIAAKPRNSLAIRDGQLIAWQEAGQVHFVESLPPVLAEQVARALRVPAAVRAADAAQRAMERSPVNEGAPAQDATGAAVQ